MSIPVTFRPKPVDQIPNVLHADGYLLKDQYMKQKTPGLLMKAGVLYAVKALSEVIT